MMSFHGTGPPQALQIAAGKIDVTLGGGELGRGFYTGEMLHVAKRWALHRNQGRDKNVVQFELPMTHWDALNISALDANTATLMRGHIRRWDKTHRYTFRVDVVWSRIVGKLSLNCDQYKWESTLAEATLNSADCMRSIV